MGKGIFWPDSVVQQLAQMKLSPLDVTHVLSHGEVIRCDKEDEDGTKMVMIGETCDEIYIRVSFWSDDNQLTMRILNVELL
jgi:L-cysteine desulfidase